MNTFKRYEKKYILTKEQKERLEAKISEHMELDGYCKKNQKYLIRNIYYDTNSNELIHLSTNKPIFKEKIRVRKYGTYQDGKNEYYLEAKRKCQSIVYKRRIQLKKEELDSFLLNGVMPIRESSQDIQILKELDYFLRVYSILPKVFISYLRVAYFDKEDPSFRLTFDSEIHSRRNNLDFDDTSFEKSLISKDMYLMEVKVGTSFPLWFARALSELEIYPSSFSKYGREYNLYLEENTNEFNII